MNETQTSSDKSLEILVSNNDRYSEISESITSSAGETVYVGDRLLLEGILSPIKITEDLLTISSTLSQQSIPLTHQPPSNPLNPSTASIISKCGGCGSSNTLTQQSNTLTQQTISNSIRKPCINCTKKHLAQAAIYLCEINENSNSLENIFKNSIILSLHLHLYQAEILYQEYHLGYPEHFPLMLGHLRTSEELLLQLYDLPKAKNIRNIRKEFENIDQLDSLPFYSLESYLIKNILEEDIPNRIKSISHLYQAKEEILGLDSNISRSLVSIIMKMIKHIDYIPPILNIIKMIK